MDDVNPLDAPPELLRVVDRRLGRRRQEHADRPAAARHQVDPRRPARRGRAHEPRARRRALRPRAADRRPARRARAGDHDRRRLPLLRHRAALVHPRRHARPRPLHAQHGHRGVDRRRRDRADRRPPAASSSSPSATPSSRRCCTCRTRRVREQDGPRRLGPRRVRRDRRRPRAHSPAASGCPSWTAIPISALNGDNVVERSDAAPWYDGPPLLEYLEAVDVAADRQVFDAARLPVQWVVRPHDDATTTTAATPARWPAARCGSATTSSCCPSGARTRIARHRHVRRPDRRGVRADVGHRAARGRPRRRARRHAVRRRRARPGGARPARRRLLARRAAARPGARYLVKHTTRTTRAELTRIEHRVDVEQPAHRARPRRARAQRHRPGHAARRRPARGRPATPTTARPAASS